MSGQSPESSSMDQVRDLLMGTQLKDMSSRLKRQEEQLLREIADVRDTMKNRLESLENFMKSETSSLMHRIKEEQSERAAALKNEQQERTKALKTEQKERNDALKAEQKERSDAVAKERHERESAVSQLAAEAAKDLAAREEALERKLTALSGTLDQAERELRQLMLSENARLSGSLDEKYKELLNTINTTAAQIRHDVVSRSSLSGLFAEAALKYSGKEESEERPAVPEAQPGSKKTDEA